MQEFFCCVWDKQLRFSTSDSPPYKASQMPIDAVYSVGTGKLWLPATLKSSDSEIHAECREQQTTSSNGGKWRRMFYHVWMTYCICHCIMTQLLLSRFLPSKQGRCCFCIHKNPNKGNFALANEVMCYASYNILLLWVQKYSSFTHNSTWAFTYHVKVMLWGEHE